MEYIYSKSLTCHHHHQFNTVAICLHRLDLYFADNISIVGMVEGGEPSGLLEVCRNGKCGSVCDDYWTDRDADVACKQLGFLGYGEL